MKLTFRLKLLIGYVGLVAIAELLTVAALDRWLSAELLAQLTRRLEDQAKGSVEWVAAGRHPDVVAERLSRIVDARVTIFGANGRVRGDSDSAAAVAEPPGDPPEARLARAGQVGRETRYSRALGEEVHYVAVPVPEGQVLRLGVSLKDLKRTIALMRQRLLLSSLLVFVLAVALSFIVARVLARPLIAMRDAAHRIAAGAYSEGARDPSLGAGPADEFGDLGRSLKALSGQLEARIGEIVAERDRVQAVLASMAEGVIVVDLKARVQLANPSAERLLGRGALVGKALDDVIDSAALRTLVRESLESGRGEAAEVQDGDRVLAATVHPLHSGGAVLVLHDVTAPRRMEEMRRRFVSDVSHEIGTPVAAIQGYAETLLAGHADASTTREFLEIIHRHARRIARLVDDLRFLSALDARVADKAIREPVSLVEVAGHVVSALRPRAMDRNATIETEVAADAIAHADPDHVERIVLNLVENAVKYGRDGGRVLVRARAIDKSVIVEVIDDGPGIAQEHIERIFDRFYRVDAGRSRDKGGTGLGLAIVKQLAEAMGGRAYVESEVGHGARFVVELPRSGV